jgi:hypothetical protein
MTAKRLETHQLSSTDITVIKGAVFIVLRGVVAISSSMFELARIHPMAAG